MTHDRWAGIMTTALLRSSTRKPSIDPMSPILCSSVSTQPQISLHLLYQMQQARFHCACDTAVLRECIHRRRGQVASTRRDETAEMCRSAPSSARKLRITGVQGQTGVRCRFNPSLPACRASPRLRLPIHPCAHMTAPSTHAQRTHKAHMHDAHVHCARVRTHIRPQGT
jgi:hypothetical protein